MRTVKVVAVVVIGLAFVADALALSVSEAHGTIHTARLDVNRHALVQRTTLPHCRYEDGSGQASACTWNVGPGRDGDGKGLAYWVGHDDRAHYVWSTDPVVSHPARSWVGKAAARVLSVYTNPHRNWHRCWLAPHGDVAKVACPNGQVIWL